MTGQDPYLPPLRAPRPDLTLVREVLAVVLILIGACGVVVAAFHFDPWAGIAVLSLAVIAAGVYLGIER